MKKIVTSIISTLLFSTMIVAPVFANPTSINLGYTEDSYGYGEYYAKSYPSGSTQGNHRVTLYEIRNVEGVSNGELVSVAYKGYGGNDLRAQVIHRINESYLSYSAPTCWYKGSSCDSNIKGVDKIEISYPSGYAEITYQYGTSYTNSVTDKNYGNGLHYMWRKKASDSYYWNHLPQGSQFSVWGGYFDNTPFNPRYLSTSTVKINNH